MNLNHAMVYVRDVGRALEFYKDNLGLSLIEGSPQFGYARLKCSQGEGTLGLHQAESGMNVAAEGVRLYFEVEELDVVCRKLMQKGVKFDKEPADMPWGWRHAYLRDPDGHEVSLYWAGEKRFKKSPPMG